jgi:glucose/arabinose dehydrogenase
VLTASEPRKDTLSRHPVSHLPPLLQLPRQGLLHPQQNISTSTLVSTNPPITSTQELPDGEDFELVKIIEGLQKPLYLTHAGDGSGRIFVLEQDGVIRIVNERSIIQEIPFLDIRSKVRSRGEQGLLGLAFHPDFSLNGHFYVHYSDKKGETVISRFSVTDDPDKADSNSEEIVLTHPQPYGNHNGGQIEFGPDGYLYIGLGDGGSRGDPKDNGQNPSTLLGAILRLDVDTVEPYSSPKGNPFVNSLDHRSEIWAFGLRNPWRFSFDRLTGDLYIADVGQDSWEEIDFQLANSSGGENYGWNQMEGNHCYVERCNPSTFVAPVAEYSHSDGCSVTGGYVYRGGANNNLKGVYMYGDYCSGSIWTLLKNDSDEWANRLFMKTKLKISSFGEDEAGEIYVVDHQGYVYWLKNS